MTKNTNYKFTIWNFTKPKSLYRDGMRLFWKSKRKMKLLGAEDLEDGWDLVPEDNIDGELSYHKSHLQPARDKKG